MIFLSKVEILVSNHFTQCLEFISYLIAMLHLAIPQHYFIADCCNKNFFNIKMARGTQKVLFNFYLFFALRTKSKKK